MLSLDVISELTDYAIEQRKPDSERKKFSLDRLKDLFQCSVENFKLTEEQSHQWFLEVIEDLKIRHKTFNSPYEPIMEEVLKEVNYQLETSMIHLYTMVPIQGLEVQMFYDMGIKIKHDVTVRKIYTWEWERYFHMLDLRGGNLPSISFEWKQGVHTEEIQKHLNDNSYFNYVIENARLLSTALQLQAPQGMAFPWVVQYIPQCQYVGNQGRVLTTSFPGMPSDRPLEMYQETNILFAYNLERAIRSCNADLRLRLEVALRRYHDGINKLDFLDRIIDQWIVIEALFGKEEGNEARQMSCRLVCFLLDNLDSEARQRAYIWVRNCWYKTRCKIVHGSYQEDYYKDFSMVMLTQDIVRRIIVKMVKASLSYKDILHKIDKISAKTNFPSEPELKAIGCDNELMSIMYDILKQCDS